MSNKYQGCANYPTWAILLWLANDHGMYDTILEFSEDIYDEFFEDGDKIDVTWEIKERYEDFISETFIYCDYNISPNEILTTGLSGDLFGFSVGMIDWYEVAESLLGDIKENREWEQSQLDNKEA